MTTPVLCFVAAIAFQVDAVTVDPHYVATSGFTSSPGDTPANTHMSARLKSPGTFAQELFSSARNSGAVKPSFGEIVILNEDGAYDEWIDFGTAGGKVTVYMGEVGAAFPAGFDVLFVAYIGNVVADFTEVRLRLRDRSFRLDRPVVTETFSGNGDLEGPAGFSARKPLAIRAPGYVAPVLVDAARQIYFVQANAADDAAVAGSSAYYAVLQGGVALGRSSNYTSLGDMLYNAPSAGYVRWYFGTTSGAHKLGPVWFRLGAAATQDVRVNVDGYVMDPDDSEHASSPGAWTMTSMCRRAGLFDVTPASMPAGLDNDLPIAPQYIADARSYLDVLQSSAFMSQSYFGFNRLDEFCCAPIKSPAALEGAETYARTFTLDQIARVRRGYLSGMEGPVWQVAVQSGQTWPSTLTAGAPDSIIEKLSRTPWQAAATATADGVRYAYQNAISVQLSTPALVEPADIAARYFLLFGAQRDVVSFVVPITAANLALNLNDPVWIEMPRFGCQSGRHFRICSLALDLAERMIRISCWGGPVATTSYALGGGATYNGNFGGGGIGSVGSVTAIAAYAPGAVGGIAYSGIAGAASAPARSCSVPAATGVLSYSAIVGAASAGGTPLESIVIACGDETTAMTTGTAKVKFRMPYPFQLVAVKASVTTAPTGSTIIFDINEAGTSVLSTKLSIDASEKTSATAASAAVISDNTLAADAEMSIDFDQVGSTVAGAGPKVTLIGFRR